MSLHEEIEFAINPEPRCACILLLDTSSSMSGEPISALNAGIKKFKDELLSDNLASKRVEIAVVTFDSEVKVVSNFATADQFEPPLLTAQNLTHTGSGICKALDILQERKSKYKNSGIAYYRPWIFMITDGSPYGESEEITLQAARRIKTAEESKTVAFFAVGVGNADMNSLRRISTREPIMLNGLNFNDMFLWLSASMESVSQSELNEQAPLPPLGWAAV
jgi:uncharacterized protein YegL